MKYLKVTKGFDFNELLQFGKAKRRFYTFSLNAASKKLKIYFNDLVISFLSYSVSFRKALGACFVDRNKPNLQNNETKSDPLVDKNNPQSIKGIK